VILAILLLSIVPRDTTLRETVATIEVSEFIDDDGRTVFFQDIFWEVNNGEDAIRAWRLIKQPSQLPEKDWATGLYSVTWQDGDVLRTVYARSVTETFEQYDRELYQRDKLPKDKRRELRPLRAGK
jgi:hypothetical protein